MTEEFRVYDCENVVLEKLELARRKSDEAGKRELVVLVHLYTKPPQDKAVKIKLDLFVGEQPIATAASKRICVEEHHHRTARIVITYPDGIMERDPAPLLKIVMQVEDDWD